MLTIAASCALASLVSLASLASLAEPSEPEVPVQSPEAMSEAESESSPELTEVSDVPEPEPTMDPSPTPEPTAEPEPVPAVAPVVVESPALAPEPPRPELDRDWVTVRPPVWRGTGLFVAAGVSFAAGFAFQAGDTLLCGNCATGVLERAFMAGSMAFAAGGGVLRGHADAYDDAALRRDRRNTRATLITGAVLTGAGAALGLVNEGLWWGCVFGNGGPYVTAPQDDFFATYSCRYGAMRGLLDVAAATTGTGLALLTWSLTYRRDARAYSRARVIGLRPSMGAGRIGLTVEGRF